MIVAPYRVRAGGGCPPPPPSREEVSEMNNEPTPGVISDGSANVITFRLPILALLVLGLLVLPQQYAAAQNLPSVFQSPEFTVNQRAFFILPEATVSQPDATVIHRINPTPDPLPVGLSFNPGTRILSGIPTVVGVTRHRYKVQGFNSQGSDIGGARRSFLITILDGPSIGGDVSGTVEEAGGVNNGLPGTPATNGVAVFLDIADNLVPTATFTAQSGTDGDFGTFSVDASGTWTYDLDNVRADQLREIEGGGDADVFEVSVMVDATTEIVGAVKINITGANDAPTNLADAGLLRGPYRSGTVVNVESGYQDPDVARGDVIGAEWSGAGVGDFAQISTTSSTVTTEWTVPTVSEATDIIVMLTYRDAAGTASSTSEHMVTILPPDVAPVFDPTVSIAPRSYVVNTPIDPPLPLPQAMSGNEGLRYAVTPLLPDGLMFNPEDRTLSGTPMAVHETTTYVYTVTDNDENTASGDSATLTFTITVVADTAPVFDARGIENEEYIVGIGIGSVPLPQATGGNGEIRYTLTPAVPGLVLMGSTLMGTPMAVHETTTHTYTAMDADGNMGPDDRDTLTFTITVVEDLVPSFGAASIAD